MIKLFDPPEEEEDIPTEETDTNFTVYVNPDYFLEPDEEPETEPQNE